MNWGYYVELFEVRSGEFSRKYKTEDKNGVETIRKYKPVPRNKLPKYIQEAMALLDLNSYTYEVGSKWEYSKTGLNVYVLMAPKGRGK